MYICIVHSIIYKHIVDIYHLSIRVYFIYPVFTYNFIGVTLGTVRRVSFLQFSARSLHPHHTDSCTHTFSTTQTHTYTQPYLTCWKFILSFGVSAITVANNWRCCCGNNSNRAAGRRRQDFVPQGSNVEFFVYFFAPSCRLLHVATLFIAAVIVFHLATLSVVRQSLWISYFINVFFPFFDFFFFSGRHHICNLLFSAWFPVFSLPCHFYCQFSILLIFYAIFCSMVMSLLLCCHKIRFSSTFIYVSVYAWMCICNSIIFVSAINSIGKCYNFSARIVSIFCLWQNLKHQCWRRRNFDKAYFIKKIELALEKVTFRHS